MSAEISVIMPVFNASRYLQETLESYRRNVWPGVELLVVDDGSTDHSLDLVRAGQPDHRLFELSRRGPAAARNLALQHARGRYIAFLDADDLWPAGTLSRLQRALCENPEWKVAQGKIQTFATGPVAERLEARLRAEPAYGVNLGAALFCAGTLRELGGLDESLRFDEDTDLWLRLWEAGIVKGRLPETTLLYRLHQDNMTRAAGSNALALLPLLKRHRDRMRGREPVATEGLASYLGWLAEDR